jgi:hypothetical protein
VAGTEELWEENMMGPMHKENYHGVAPHSAFRRRNWRRIHHSPLFWVGAVVFLAAITTYVLSDDLSWWP